MSRLASSAIIHTTVGDIHISLFFKEYFFLFYNLVGFNDIFYFFIKKRCPKTVENFAVHSRNGYYNGNIFHRVIKQFMIQTGDPQGNGMF